MRRAILWTVLGLGCSAGPAGDDEATPSGDTAPETPPEELRRPVQRGSTPNAPEQSPAFAEQTRAPQPAERTRFTTEVVAGGLERPWGLEVLPDGRLIVTEKPGRLRIVAADGRLGDPIAGVPDVTAASDQGGLLDVALAPDFASSRMVYLSYAEDRGAGANGATVARARLSDDETELEGPLDVIFRQMPAWASTKHYGCRLVFAPDGNLFVTLGERSNPEPRELAQDPTNHLGTVVRIAPDGSVPDDNPFVGDPAGADEVWSYGHRNPQSATLDGEGRLWTVEHGPAGGDELNRPLAGRNYGWPEITYGENYNGAPIGEGLTEKAGMEQPVYYWDPVIAPSGMAYYDADLFEGFRGDFLIGGLQAQAVVRLSMRGDLVYTEEWLDVGARVRDVRVAPDGSILALVDASSGQILRLTPR